MKILIPTCRKPYEIFNLMTEVEKFTLRAEVIASCLPESASVNRNACLDRLKQGELAVMIDDDIRGFYPGWIHDILEAFDDPKVAVVSARLLKEDGTFGPTCCACKDASPEEIELTWVRPHCIIPTAAIAFRHTGIRFHEGYVGSGWEDNDWMRSIQDADPEAKFIQSNRCRLIHLNEMKGQKGSNWEHNKALFNSRWPNPPQVAVCQQ